MVDHAKLPNLVIVAVVGFIYFWRKMKAFRPLEEDTVVKFNLNGIHVVDFYSLKLSFTLKIVQNPFLRTPDGYDGRSFRRRGGVKNTFLLTFNVQNLFVFGQ